MVPLLQEAVAVEVLETEALVLAVLVAVELAAMLEIVVLLDRLTLAVVAVQ
jgi:hypothetical protein